LGAGGTESACLDVPNAGVLTINSVVCQKSRNSDAGWIIHYSGESQGFHNPSSVKVHNLTMVAPPALQGHPSWPITGFANQSGDGPAVSGSGSHFVPVQADTVQVFGLSASACGLPCRILNSPPVIDLKPPMDWQA
jgi:hypothetical protein